ncbi:hypothetical protein I7I50_05443 [Histoplasma capsulatum G186AR]|uniref:Uncharacterized protein n=1 Tax=Ajellomyces capsulatus TaxID=5037 RepID=A0A8H7ZB98_AJECA|nr:hypothetical protein I7I52_03704 [Histoplasma capsulatum]QSS76102.1 hypothetical protein I7I50_05443 [Histoplasma capsulatum G186AR]
MIIVTTANIQIGIDGAITLPPSCSPPSSAPTLWEGDQVAEKLVDSFIFPDAIDDIKSVYEEDNCRDQV